MGITIKSIELKNWFVYKGDYKDNKIDFKPGFNIIVAANDVGKTKLHNAFRWLLDNQVIIRNNKGSSNEKYKLVTLNENTLLSGDDKSGILNNKAFVITPLNGQIDIGVKLHYTDKNERFEKERILTKQISLRKESDNKVSIINTTEKVQKIEGNNVRSSSDNFEDCTKRIIPKNLRSFFLVQGETLDFMTPLGGEQLKKTLTKFVDIGTLSNFLEKSESANKKITDLRSKFENKDARGKKAEEDYNQKKHELENDISEYEDKLIPKALELKKASDKKVENFKTKFENSKKKAALKDKIQKFDERLSKKQALIEDTYKSLKENYIKNEFFLNDFINKDNFILENLQNDLRDFISKRNSELQDELNKDEQEMLYSLEKSQPKPEILDQMLTKGKCYVCSNTLNQSSINYIENTLIPYFKGELKNQQDKQINVYGAIADFVKNLNFHKNFNSYDDRRIKDYINKIIELENQEREIEEQKASFIEENGNIKISEEDNLNIATYSTALKDQTTHEKHYNDLILECQEKQSKLETLIKNPPEGSTQSNETQKAVKLESFNGDLNKILVNIIDKDYKKFRDKLQEEVSNNFRKFTKHNKNLNSQKIIVDYELDSNKEPNFEIKVIDPSGFNMSDGGGASQSLRQLSLIFGLISLTNKLDPSNQVDVPFIADAPTSNMTSALAYTFYESQLSSSNQNILMTKELWDDRKSKLNSEGTRLLEETKKYENSAFWSITSIKNNDPNKADIEINKINQNEY